METVVVGGRGYAGKLVTPPARQYLKQLRPNDFPAYQPRGISGVHQAPMSNVPKLKKRAGEFEQKKQFDKALAVYLQILEEVSGSDDEADIALFNRVGDLMLQQGNVSEAVDHYERAVDRYAESG